MKPVIFGMAGTALSADEKAFFADSEPAGYIIFGRNIESPDQLRALTDSLRDLHGRDDLMVMIDQEGGRVQRMTKPHWPAYPTAEAFDHLYETAPATAIEAARANAEALGHDLAQAGITVNCAPVLDVRQPETTQAIGDRAYGGEPLRVAALGRATLQGLAKAGVVGVIKHIPGHGRAVVDSHKELPRVEADAETLAQDVRPFATLADAPMAMTAHIVYPAWDTERCATHSPTIIQDIIRGTIGFDGLLFSDDLDMEALADDVPTRAVRAIEAGCDIALNCWAKMPDMIAMVERLPDMSDATRDRMERAVRGMALAPVAEAVDARDALIADRDALFAAAQAA